MGCSGSKNRKTNLIKKGNKKKYQIDESKLWKGLSDVQKTEYVINVNLDEYLAREELPKEMYRQLLTAVKNNQSKEYNAILKKYKISQLDAVIGLEDKVDIGSKKNCKGSSLNPLHWAVYTGNIDAVKAIINNCVFNIITVGKVPSDTGLANESETSIQDLDTQHESSLKISESRYSASPRSLILFWPIDYENIELFSYIWSLENINWGIKTLKFNLAMICVKENPKLLEKFLFSPTFSSTLNNLPFDEAMDFLEICDEIKAELFETKEMLVYDFMGELMSLENLEHLREVHTKLSERDFSRIKSSERAMKKIEELREFIDGMEDSEEQEEINELIREFE